MLSRRAVMGMLVGAAVLPPVLGAFGRPAHAAPAGAASATLADALRRTEKPNLAFRQVAQLSNDHYRVTFHEATWDGGRSYVRDLELRTDSGWVAVTDPERRFDEQWVVLTGTERPSPRYYYSSATPHWVAFDGFRQLGPRTVELTSTDPGVYDLTVRWSLGREHPELHYTVTARQAGHFVVGYQSLDTCTAEDAEEVLCGIRQHARVIGSPESLSSWELFAPMSLVQRTIAGRTVTSGLFIPSDVIAYEHERDLGPYRQPFGMSLLNDEAHVQPVAYAPQAGDRSLLEPGQSLGYAFGVQAHDGLLYDAYVALCRGEYGFTAYRENVYDTSLTQTAFNIMNLVGIEPDGDDSETFVPSFSGWWNRAKGFADSENDQAVRTSVAGVLLSANYLLSPPDRAGDFYDRRARQMMEYHVSRRNHGHTPIIGRDVYNDSSATVYGLGGVAVDANTLVPLYRQTRGQNAALHRLALDTIKAPPFRDTRTPWNNALQAYVLTGDEGWLAEAEALARRYLRDQVMTPYSNNQGDGVFVFSYSKHWLELFVMYELTGERDFLDAAYREAQRFVTQTMVRPVPDGTVLAPVPYMIDMQFDDWNGHLLPDYPLDDIEPEEVPAWYVSTTGQTIEQLITYRIQEPKPHPGGGMVMNPIWAPFLLRLAHEAGDEFLVDFAHNLVIGRWTNYPGYYNRQFSAHHLKPDFPLTGPPGESCIYFHHAPAQLGLTLDYLFSEHYVRSDGRISFPKQFECDFVFFKFSTYGHEPGTFFGEDGVWPYLPEGIVGVDHPQLNWLTGVGNDSLYLSLTNSRDAEVAATVTFDQELTGIDPRKRYEVQVLRDNGRWKHYRLADGKLPVTVSARGITVVVVRGAGRPAPWHWLPSAEDRGAVSYSFDDALPGAEGGLTRGMLLVRPDRSAADAYVQSDSVEAATLAYWVNDGPEQVIADKPYPNEWTVPLTALTDTFGYEVRTPSATSQRRTLRLPSSLTGVAAGGAAAFGSLAAPATASPSDEVTVRVRLTAVAGLSGLSVALTAPAGWTATPSQPVPDAVAAGASATGTFTVTVPADAALAVPHPLAATASWSGGSADLEPVTVELVDPVRLTAITPSPAVVPEPGGSIDLRIAVLNRGPVPVTRTVTVTGQFHWSFSETTFEVEVPPRTELEHVVRATTRPTIPTEQTHFVSANLDGKPKVTISLRVEDPDIVTSTNNDYPPRYDQTGSWLISGLAGADGAASRYSPEGVTGGTATWTPDLPAAGTYAVDVWYPSNHETSTAANYVVRHAGGETEFVVNQQEQPRSWRELGRFEFAAGMEGHVRIEVRDAGNGYTRLSGARFRRL
ncbi:golvesin C-terminal-like domain-containing protein [Jiangella anatolica]|uniref:Uncharacterized protein n=1 Tax=Jiangella anatolica TaxID=2670374 RepID=A0A2W2BIB7_9ACTN|nr:NEW3 domain-containing protein [Jiangella anatolica]PZF85742.1 hypothetical protein C1I92_03755 [Jiangella anatolica]